MAELTDPDGGGAWIPSRVFLDANLIINGASAAAPLHEAALRTLARLTKAAAAGATRLYVTPLVFDEVWWKLAEILYVQAYGVDGWRALRREHRHSQALEHCARDVAGATRRLLGNPFISVVAVTPEDVPTALAHVAREEQPYLDPRDAFHLAVMKRLGIEGIVTNDPDFADAPGIVAIPYSAA